MPSQLVLAGLPCRCSMHPDKRHMHRGQGVRIAKGAHKRREMTLSWPDAAFSFSGLMWPPIPKSGLHGTVSSRTRVVARIEAVRSTLAMRDFVHLPAQAPVFASGLSPDCPCRPCRGGQSGLQVDTGPASTHSHLRLGLRLAWGGPQFSSTTPNSHTPAVLGHPA